MMTPMLAVSLVTLEQLAVSGLVIGCIYALAGLGFNAIFNATGVINFAQGDFLVLGGFFFYAATATWHLSLIPAALVAVAIVTAIGAFVQLAIVLPGRGTGHIGRGASLIGVSLLVTALTADVWGVNPLGVREFTPGAPYILGEVVITRQQVWIVGVTVGVVVLLQLFFQRTTAGIAMRAASLNADAARAVGVSVKQMALIAFILAAALGAIGGILITPITSVSYSTGFALTIKGFTAAILGGLGSMYGAVVGGVTLGLIEALSAAYITSGYQSAVPMFVLILVFMLRPGGILNTTVSRV
jgi:branched-chain amino acid transport system permease protein